MKKIQDIINRLRNVYGQMEVGALLTCGSGITSHNACSGGRYPTLERPRSLSRQNDLGRYLARTTLRHNV